MTGPTRRRLVTDPDAGPQARATLSTPWRVPAPVDADPVAAGRQLRSLPPRERAAEARRLQRAYGNRWLQQATAPQPLPDAVRARMEAAFGQPLGDVTVAESIETEAMDAAAFTSGAEIVFRPGSYDPHSPEGLEVLGHEVAHVLQQRAGAVAAPVSGKVNEDPVLEAEADRAGRRAACGEPAELAATGEAGAEGEVGARAVVQPMRWPFGRRRRATGAPPPVAPPPVAPPQVAEEVMTVNRPAAPVRVLDAHMTEHMRLQRGADEKMRAAVAAANRGDYDGQRAALTEYDAVMTEMADLWHHHRGGEGPDPMGVQSIMGTHDPEGGRGQEAGPARSESDYDIVEIDHDAGAGRRAAAPPGSHYSHMPPMPEPQYAQTPSFPEPPHYYQTPANPPAPQPAARSTPVVVPAPTGASGSGLDAYDGPVHPLLRSAVRHATGTLSRMVAEWQRSDTDPARAAMVSKRFRGELDLIITKSNDLIAQRQQQVEDLVARVEQEISALVTSYTG